MFRSIKWLYPGLRIKRWIFVLVFSVFLGTLGAAFSVWALEATQPAPSRTFGGLAVLCFAMAAAAFTLGLYRLLKSVGELVKGRIGTDRGLVDLAFSQRWIGRGPRVVALGGGTGMSTLLAGLKNHTEDITAVVSVADDGGSSGRLRHDFDMVPPGDIRKCLIALADEEPRMGDLLRYRFTEGEFAGHSFGNLFLTVLTRLTGNFGDAVREANRILQVRGRVIPATLDPVTLVATHPDGLKTTGQRLISETERPIVKVEIQPNDGPPAPDILEAIRDADLIVLGPGSLYTSVIPNLLIRGIPEAIALSGAVKVFVCNVMNHEGETRDYSLADHLSALKRHGATHIIDYVLVNSGYIPRGALDEKTMQPVRVPKGFDAGAWGVKIVQEDVIDRADLTRHDPNRLAAALIKILAQAKA
jgi:uncharacterized cofD-like protein